MLVFDEVSDKSLTRFRVKLVRWVGDTGAIRDEILDIVNTNHVYGLSIGNQACFHFILP